MYIQPRAAPGVGSEIMTGALLGLIIGFVCILVIKIDQDRTERNRRKYGEPE